MGALLVALGRHPYRPAHFHYIIKKKGYQTLTTHLFDPDDAYIHSDAVFGVKESLMAEFKRIDNTQKRAEQGLNHPYYDVGNDIVMARSR